jgi:GTP-binding protein
MIVKSAKFVVSLAELKPFSKQGLPEIAMAGKSNVGKSSLINSFAFRTKLARTSSEPGKTRLINFYEINEAFFLVDLPGYGFAKASKDERDKWGAMIEGYLENSKKLVHVLQLVDIRHEPTADDQMMVEYLRHYEIPFTVVATKCDKLSKAARGRNIPVICRKLAVQPWEIIQYSADDGTGREALHKAVERVLGNGETPGALLPDPQRRSD